jgi:ABC-type phosphate transport system permease subunit
MEGTAIDKAFGTALVLIIFILIINLSTNVLLSRFAKNVG